MLSTLRYRLPHAPPARLLAFRRLVEAAPVGELLDALLGSDSPARAVIGPRARLDHFGFLIAPGTERRFREAAAAAGFDRPTPVFASRHVARELGWLAGAPFVPTGVVKQTGTVIGHGTVAIEGFVPDVDVARAEAWIERDVASHLAIDLDDPRDFARVVDRLPALGLPMPPFMDGPCHVDAERATIAYFELGPDAELPRLEVRTRDRRRS